MCQQTWRCRVVSRGCRAAHRRCGFRKIAAAAADLIAIQSKCEEPKTKFAFERRKWQIASKLSRSTELLMMDLASGIGTDNGPWARHTTEISVATRLQYTDIADLFVWLALVAFWLCAMRLFSGRGQIPAHNWVNTLSVATWFVAKWFFFFVSSIL